MSKKGMTYADTGVDYGSLDPFKLLAQRAASQTDRSLNRFGFSPVSWTRGESVFLIETPWAYFGFLIEGLGTKSLVADALAGLSAKMQSLMGKSFYKNIAQCNVAMAVNDLITLGAIPLVYGQYLAVADGSWFDDESRSRDLAEGTRDACIRARCTWGGGETPSLKGIIVPGTADLAGGTMGVIIDKNKLINPANIRHGDSIVIIESSGIHANGLTMARSIADKLPKGYLTVLPDGRTYGETLLDSTLIYVDVVEDCLDAGIPIHYGVNGTGHAFRKLMRPDQPFTYVIETLPKEQSVFKFIQKHGPVVDKEMYGTFNMGLGYALYVPREYANETVEIANGLGHSAFIAGYIEEGDKKVVIKPKNLVFAGNTLNVR